MKILSLMLLLYLGFSGYSLAQVEISGVVNSYAKVTSLGPDFVIVPSTLGFAEKDTVLVIQMKGGVIYTPDPTDGNYGLLTDYVGSPGLYEFLIVDQVIEAESKIVFMANLINNYSVDGFVQIVKVRSVSSARVDGELTCEPWDPVAGTGGVVALIVGGKLELLENIDVAGKGFRGGLISEGSNICIDSDPARNYYYYDSSSNLSGFKGEGIAVMNETLVPLLPAYAKGKGPNYTGGGGGNGRFAGGGGGGHVGIGGIGDKEASSCSDVFGSGGAKTWDIVAFSTSLFPGSGGGASTYFGAGIASPGGNGGGMVIIIADEIEGNGYSINANGSAPLFPASGEAGAGGGGAGGSIAISTDKFGSSNLRLEVRGGNGGAAAAGGNGGGGGGGRIWIKPSSAPGNVVADFTRGVAGGGFAANGTNGETKFEYPAVLNGFLFNSIRSFVTVSDIDSICYGQIPPKLLGTDPVGGMTPYSYQWQKSYDSITWITLTNTESPGVNFTPYDAETGTLWFRRVVTDNTPVTPLVDISKAVKIIVQPLITDNIVGQDTIICFGQDPLELKHYNSGPGGGNNIYSYEWNESSDNVAFIPAINVNNASSYDPPSLTATMYYHRVITSGRCVDTSNVVTVTVLPLILNNTIAADQVICRNELFADLTGSTPAGGAGAGSYTYLWLSSDDATSWGVAEGITGSINYDPVELSAKFPGTQYFRRAVFSGLNDCCADTSSTVTLLMHPLITDNTISILGGTTLEICFEGLPAIIAGLLPGGGDGLTYTYTWQDSTKGQSWTDLPGFIDSDAVGFQPPPLQDSTSYRRIVRSSACADTSNVIRIFVHKPVADFAVSLISGVADTTICSGATPNLLLGEDATGGDGSNYLFQWKQSSDNIDWSANAPGISDGRDYQPPANMTATLFFRRETSSGECQAVSNVITINVLPPIGNNLMPAGQTVCYNSVPAIINASTPTGGSGTYSYLWKIYNVVGDTWDDAPGVNNQEDYQPPVVTVPTQFRRLIFSGPADCCFDESLPVEIGIYDLPTGSIVSADVSICQKDITAGITLTLDGAWPLTVVLDPGSVTLPAASASPFTANVTPGTTKTYTIASITDANGCQATEKTGSYTVTVITDPVAITIPDEVDDVCGLTYDLTAGVVNAGTGAWIIPAGVPVGTTDAVSQGVSRVTLTEGSYGTWPFLWVVTNEQCADTASLDVTFWQEPDVADAGEDVITVLDFVRLTAVMPVRYTHTEWSYQGNSSNILFSDETENDTWVSGLNIGNNIFVWHVGNGVCRDTSQVRITYNPVPEGFSPDGNGINDFFEIPGLEEVDNELVILNMKGAELIRFTNYSSLTGYWDGKDRSGKDVPDGTYYYLLTVSKASYSSRIGGYVIIKRKNYD
ncbi:MAG: gliding motility-associated C-terminal domain-containing protein [Bacteroidales bacterium]